MDPLFKKSDRIFLAGSSGMVGSSIKRALLKSGYGSHSRGGVLFTPTREELDLFDFQKVKSWMLKKKPDVVIIAAAKVGGILANNNYPADFLLQNLKIQTNIIETAWRAGVRRLLFLGSSCIYPKNADQPLIEDCLMSSELETTNEWYAIAKITGIKLCDSLRKQYGFDAISLMPTNLYGPNDNYHSQNSHVIPGLIKKFLNAKTLNLQSVECWGTGAALREFLYVDDLAEAVIFCLRNWDPCSSNSPKDKSGNPLTYLNVGTGQEISIKNLAELIAEKVGYKGAITWDKTKPDGTKRKLLNIDNITNLGWLSKTKLDLGLEKTIVNLKNQELL